MLKAYLLEFQNIDLPSVNKILIAPRVYFRGNAKCNRLSNKPHTLIVFASFKNMETHVLLLCENRAKFRPFDFSLNQ